MTGAVAIGSKVVYQDGIYTVRAVDGAVLELAYHTGRFFRLVHISSVIPCPPDLNSRAERRTMTEALAAMFCKADYSHIARDATVTVSIAAAEMAALLGAYDRGLDALDQDERDGLNAVIGKLKDELWP